MHQTTPDLPTLEEFARFADSLPRDAAAAQDAALLIEVCEPGTFQVMPFGGRKRTLLTPLPLRHATMIFAITFTVGVVALACLSLTSEHRRGNVEVATLRDKMRILESALTYSDARRQRLVDQVCESVGSQLPVPWLRMRPVWVTDIDVVAMQLNSDVDCLAQALRDPNDNVRVGAAVLLANIGDNAIQAIPELLKGIGDENATVRAASALALTRQGNNSPEVKRAVVEALADTSLPFTLHLDLLEGLDGFTSTDQQLVALLESMIRQGFIAPGAAKALGKVTGRPALPDLYAAAVRPEREGRWIGFGVEGGGGGGGENLAPPPAESVEGLLQRLDDRSEKAREDAADELSERLYTIPYERSADVTNRLVAALDDGDVNVRYAAAEALARLQRVSKSFDHVLAVLLEGLEKGRSSRRITICDLFANYLSDRRSWPFSHERTPEMVEQTEVLRPKILPALQHALTDQDCDVRYAAALGMMRFGSISEGDRSAAKAILKLAAKSETGIVQHLAILSLDLNDFGPDLATTVPKLIEIVRVKCADSTRANVRAGGGGFFNIASSLQNEQPFHPNFGPCEYRRRFAVIALGRIGAAARDALKDFRSIMNDSAEDQDMQYLAAQAALRINSDNLDAVEVLAKALGDTNVWVRLEAAKTLGEATSSETVINVLTAALHDEDEDVRGAVKAALEKLMLAAATANKDR